MGAARPSPKRTETSRSLGSPSTDDVILLRKLLTEHSYELYHSVVMTDEVAPFVAVIDDEDAERLAERMLADHRFSALIGGAR